MDKKILINLVYWGMILVVIATCIFVVIFLRSSGKECLADPLEFYARKTGAECFCVGDFLK